MLPINLPCSWTKRCSALFWGYAFHKQADVIGELLLYCLFTSPPFPIHTVSACAIQMLSSKSANKDGLTCKSYYAVSSKVRHCSDMLVSADPHIKKTDIQVEACIPCVNIPYVLSSVSFQLQLNYACCQRYPSPCLFNWVKECVAC